MVGPRVAAFLLLLTFLAGMSSASTLEDVSNGIISYQFDGDTHHDAPDTCAQADPQWSLALGHRTDGMLVPPDDLSDVFVVDVSSADVGTRIDIRLREAPGTQDLDLGAFAPACDGDVFAQHNQPVPFPAPPAPASGQRQVAVDPSAPTDPCGSDWAFLINGLHDGEAPASIHVAWTDGSEGTVPVTRAENGQVAKYRTTVGAAFTLKGAWANLPADWEGTFKVAHAPCAATNGGAVYGPPAGLFDDRISFTPIRAGPHLVVVTLAPASVPPPPTSITLTCHTCVAQLEPMMKQVSYSLRADQAAA